MAVIKLIFLWIFTSTVRCDNNSDLLSVIQIFRSGQRTPLTFYPNDPYASQKYWPVGPGELVNEGKKQMYDLGHFTRARYAGFLPDNYDKKDFVVYTTDIDRAIMSAQCFTAGLYPPHGQQVWNADLKWQPIPVHLAEVNTLQYNCNAYWYDVNYTLEHEPFYQQEFRMYELTFETISRISGTTVRNPLDVHPLYDTLFVEDLNGYNISEWRKNDYYYPYPMNTLSAFGLKALSYTDRLKKMNTGFFWHYLIEHFEDILSENPSKSKFKAYSAHAPNIFAILNTLGKYKFEPHNPAFGSSIFFELRKKNGKESRNKAFLNIWYKQGDNLTQANVYGCSSDCLLSDFKRLTKLYTVDSEEEYAGLCERSGVTLTKEDV